MDVSFIIPTLNEEHEITHTLNAIRESVAHISHEIIVVDNGSDDQTTEMAKEIADLVIVEPTKTVGGLRNVGASYAKGRILVFNDADVRLTKQWAQKFSSCMVQYLEESDVVGGALAVPESPYLIHKYWFKPLLRNKESKVVNYVGTGNMIVRKDLFLECKGFDERLETGEDYDFCVRMKKNGARILYDSDLEAIHIGYPHDLKSFVRREFWHGKGDFQSLSNLFTSKTALFSLLFVLTNITFIVSLFLENYYFSYLILFVAGILLLYFSLHKTPSKIGVYGRAVHMGLSFLYLWARGLSFWGNLKLLKL
ncbi:hypothetical protein CLH62_01780 [Marinobacter guineae]|uniref:Glycosyltransferase 2-like domain-containing protein n=1 Tax=Marinobacter guineae TaxID=432303 RepID=A0A2G1VHU1_9GAMM|nr:glycosyltransferase [Marinobacter guineae]PHQ26353.1 hypothetical protein CLH62_01780 [Marinobacter guineae]